MTLLKRRRLTCLFYKFLLVALHRKKKLISMASLLPRLRALPIPTLAPDISSNLSFSQSETLSLPKPISPNSVSLSVTSPTLPLLTSNYVYHKPSKNITFICICLYVFYKKFWANFFVLFWFQFTVAEVTERPPKASDLLTPLEM